MSDQEKPAISDDDIEMMVWELETAIQTAILRRDPLSAGKFAKAKTPGPGGVFKNSKGHRRPVTAGNRQAANFAIAQ
jgi:hypothetical protein